MEMAMSPCDQVIKEIENEKMEFDFYDKNVTNFLLPSCHFKLI